MPPLIVAVAAAVVDAVVTSAVVDAVVFGITITSVGAAIIGEIAALGVAE